MTGQTGTSAKMTFLRPETVTIGRHTLRCEYRADALDGNALQEVCDLVGPRGRRGTVVYDRIKGRLTLLGTRFGSLTEERAALDAAFVSS